MQTAESNESYSADSPVKAPILIPESPLINLLAQMTQTQRMAIRRVRLSPALGYDTQQIFDTAEQLYQWLTPGKKIHTESQWPAELLRNKWFRLDITGEALLAAARSSTYSQSIKSLIGRANF